MSDKKGGLVMGISLEESLEIEHGGEKLYITVIRVSQERARFVIKGPKTFNIVRKRGEDTCFTTKKQPHS